MPNDSAAKTVTLQCPAKINLHLRVGPRRDDGFHPLLSWMCTVGLFDTLSLKALPAGSSFPAPVPSLAPMVADPIGSRLAIGDAPPGESGNLAGARGVERVATRSIPSGLESGATLALICDPPGLPCDQRNLVVRVANGWSPARGIALEGNLRKRVPVGAGLGGGSSDAAHMILALQSIWPDSPAKDLLGFAAIFGSDVPFFLSGSSSVCEGRGEIVRPIDRPMPRWAILILPPIHMATPDVYRRFDAMGLGRSEDLDCQPDWAGWTRLDARGLLENLVNDLEPPAFALRPDLADLLVRIEREIRRPVRMSGSGSSLFTLYDEQAPAEEAVRQIKTLDENMRVEAVELAPRIANDLISHV